MMMKNISEVEVAYWYFDYIFGGEVLLDERFAGVLLLILVHVVDLADAGLLDDLGAGKTGEVGRVQAATHCLPDPHLNQSRLLSVQAQALVQLLSQVAVAAFAPHPVAGGQTLRSPVVACRHHPVLGVDDHCPHRGLHAV